MPQPRIPCSWAAPRSGPKVAMLKD
jgi:hypothetical protein